ncbi:hypothetical protein vBEcoMphAPEC6_02810 [Escherichia phage ph0011]|nr:hypothetical protein vBEcoMphAPEC6_02810 [Escherichia phage ph0011]
MLEFFNSNTMLGITLIYMFVFLFYHSIVISLWYFKRKVVFKLYSYDNVFLVVYSIVQGGFILFGIMTYFIYRLEIDNTPHITQYVVFSGLIVWLLTCVVYFIIKARDKIKGEF